MLTDALLKPTSSRNALSHWKASHGLDVLLDVRACEAIILKPDEIFETLPSHCRRLVEEIEAASGLEVKVLSGQEFRDSYQGPVFGGALPNKPEAVSSPDHDLVLYPGEELSLTHDDYHHELLHLHIAHVRGQPEIRAVEPERDGQMAGMLNNELDHLVIHLSSARRVRPSRTHGSRQSGPFGRDFLR